MSKVINDVDSDNEYDCPNNAVISEVSIARINDQNICVSPNKFISYNLQIYSHIHFKNKTFPSIVVLGERLIGISKYKRGFFIDNIYRFFASCNILLDKNPSSETVNFLKILFKLNNNIVSNYIQRKIQILYRIRLAYGKA